MKKNDCCPNCGAPLPKYAFNCEYCGTKFKEKLEPIQNLYILNPLQNKEIPKEGLPLGIRVEWM